MTTTHQLGCRLCGGTAGTFFDGAHALCAARAKRGAPTPSLGDVCPCCHGVGGHTRSKCGPLNPNQDAIERWCPGCVTCGATGAINVADTATQRDTMTRYGHRKPAHWAKDCRKLEASP